MEERDYEIFVDTGGTFTDCLGKDPQGNWTRRKVLSNGSLRGVIKSWHDPKTLIVSENWGLKSDIIRGYRLNILNQKHEISYIQSYELEQNLIQSLFVVSF